MNDDLSEARSSSSQYVSLFSLFRAVVQKYADSVAVVENDKSTTYGDLYQQATRVSQWLRAHGCDTESVVGVLMEESTASVVVMLGVWGADAVFLPLSRSYPPRRTFEILQGSGATILISDTKLGDPRELDWPLQVVSFGELREFSHADGPFQPPAIATDSSLALESLAYQVSVAFPARHPSRVQVSHGNVAPLLQHLRGADVVRPYDVVAQLSSLPFDTYVLESALALTSGASLAILGPRWYKKVDEVPSQFESLNISVAVLSPSALRMLLAAVTAGGLRSLRSVLLGGEELQQKLVDRLFAAVDSDNLSVFSVYGPSETAMIATIWQCEKGLIQEYVPVGRAVAGTEVRLLDSHLRPVSEGEVGEIFISGFGVARGYQDSRGLTADRFLPATSSKIQDTRGQRMYRTGDLGRLREGGVLELLGRVNPPAKIRGFQVELSEVERALASHEQVADAAVVLASSGADGEARLIGYVVSENGIDLPEAHLQEYLRRRLPSYMVPSRIVSLPRIPYLPSGKVNRSKLPSPPSKVRLLDQPAVLARGPIEEFLVKEWQEVLDRGEVGVEDSFFDLGGDEIRAMQLVTRIREIWGRTFSFRDFVAKPTIRELAGMIEKSRAEDLVFNGSDSTVGARLKHAHEVRELLDSVIGSNWLGLEILVALDHFSPLSVSQISQVVSGSLDRLVGVIARLHSAQAIKIEGYRFSIASVGVDVVSRITEATRLDFRLSGSEEASLWDSLNE